MTSEDKEILKLIEDRKESKATMTMAEAMKRLNIYEIDLTDYCDILQ
jgi:hypothetical protein